MEQIKEHTYLTNEDQSNDENVQVDYDNIDNIWTEGLPSKITRKENIIETIKLHYDDYMYEYYKDESEQDNHIQASSMGDIWNRYTSN